MTVNPESLPDTPQVKKQSRIGAAWGFLVTGAVILVLLLIFILQNTDNVRLSFLGWHPTLPLGVLTLLAAVVGGLIMSLVGGIRLIQLKREAKRS